MAAIIEMPKLSDTMTEGTLLRWLKKIGDPVEVGDEIAEVETDKATMVMEAFEDGVLQAIYVQPGQKAPLGAKLALLLEPGEEAPSESSPAVSSPPKSDLWGGAALSSPPPKTSAAPHGKNGERTKASPLARKLADEGQLDLAQLHGSGPAGRIIQRDVLAARAKDTAPAKEPPARVTAAPSPSLNEDQRIPLSGMRSIIAERLLASKTQIPHFYLHIEVDAKPIWDLQKRMLEANAKVEGANKITINDLLLKATACAAARVPEANASWQGDCIVRHAAVNLSIAIAIEDGLVTPVIRGAQNLSLTQISLAVKDFAARARAKKLSPDEFTGGTLTVSNLGAYGIDSFSAIINPPQAVILAIGAIRDVPVINHKGKIVPGQRMSIGLSGDHRVVDGAVAARFLGELRRLVEEPALMLL